MATQKPQTLKNHVRIDLLHTGFTTPVAGIGIIIAVVHLIQQPGWISAYFAVASVAAVVAILKIRTNALRVQDRVIRLEERLRLEKLLKEPLRKRIPELKTSQLIAIRFASDKEAAGLVKKALDGMEREDLKKEIKDWRPDHLRV